MTVNEMKKYHSVQRLTGLPTNGVLYRITIDKKHPIDTQDAVKLVNDICKRRKSDFTVFWAVHKRKKFEIVPGFIRNGVGATDAFVCRKLDKKKVKKMVEKYGE